MLQKSIKAQLLDHLDVEIIIINKNLINLSICMSIIINFIDSHLFENARKNNQQQQKRPNNKMTLEKKTKSLKKK